MHAHQKFASDSSGILLGSQRKYTDLASRPKESVGWCQNRNLKPAPLVKFGTIPRRTWPTLIPRKASMGSSSCFEIARRSHRLLETLPKATFLQLKLCQHLYLERPVWAIARVALRKVISRGRYGWSRLSSMRIVSSSPARDSCYSHLVAVDWQEVQQTRY